MRLPVLPLLLCLLLAACAEGERCGVSKLADLPLTMAGNLPVLQVGIDGRVGRFLLDTGADTSVIDRRTAAAFALPVTASHGQLHDIAGAHPVVQARADSVQIGELRFSDRRFIVADHMPLDGVIGLDFLKADHLEIDEPAGRAALYSGRLCDGQLPFADAGGHAMRAIQLESLTPAGKIRRPQLLVAAVLDGQAGLAMLDSGALSGTLVLPEMVAKLGLTPETLTADRAVSTQAIAGKVQMRLHGFEQLDLVGESFRHPGLYVSPTSVQGVHIILGAEYFRRHHIWLDYVGQRVFIAPVTQPGASGS